VDSWMWLFFFFSSRRRHTRFSRDWSSDVCSSDLAADDVAAELFLQVHRNARPLGEEACQHLRQEFGDRGGVGEDADVSGLVGAIFGELAFQVVHLAPDQPCLLHELVPGWSELHAPAVTV